jgi:predicted CXXCH cytochrome family protein
MHYSQDGRALAEWGEDGPYEALLTTDCVGCHMGTNAGGTIPFVFSADAPMYGMSGTAADTNTLAGGNFYWVAQAGGNSQGHNVAGLVAGDTELSAPPGFSGGRAAADGSTPGGGSWPPGQQVTCAGIYGCHGNHSESSLAAAVRGGHHKGVGGAITAPAASPAGGFRMLVGVAGYEDVDWEFRPTASAHNQYKGGGGGADNSTISSLCARCHGQFHSASGSGSPWMRHPVDYDMGATAATSDYRSYGGAGINAYRPDTPVASVDVSRVVTNVAFAGDTIVTCVSCHRAHGSPYHKMMRWDYAGNIGTGCAACHTSKD